MEVIKPSEAKRGFFLLPRRWVVERSFGWAARFRRLARDYERLPSTVAGFHRTYAESDLTMKVDDKLYGTLASLGQVFATAFFRALPRRAHEIVERYRNKASLLFQVGRS